MVEIIESCLVAPIQETPKHKIWLSNFDFNVSRYHVPLIYVYRADGDRNLFPVEAMKAALAKALVAFYPLAGRLVADWDGRPEIDCTGDGVLFVLARSNRSIKEFGDFAPSPEIRQMLVPSVESADPPSILFMVQVTLFKWNWVTLGIGLHHMATDGKSLFHFINYWANITRGITELATPPFLDRAALRSRTPPNADLFRDAGHNLNSTTATAKLIQSSILKLSGGQVTLLKDRSKQQSTFRAVVAHVWRCACMVRGLTPDQVTRVYLVVDVRKRLNPPLPDGYFGNAVCRVSAIATAREIMSSSISFGADKIRCAIDRVTDAYVRSAIDYVELQKNEGKIESYANRFSTADLIANSWLAFPTHDVDFGCGKPEFMGRAIMLAGGIVYVVSDKDGGVSIPISLEMPNMERFKKVFYEELKHGVSCM
nr:putative acyltransferase 9 [Crocosmia x crocosmiiflora]